MISKGDEINAKYIHRIPFDFRDKPMYRHVSIMPNMSHKSDEEKALMALRLMNLEWTFNATFICLRDAHTYTPCENTECTQIVLISREKPEELYKGIYDIILKECKDITSLSLVFESNDGITTECPLPVPNSNQETYRVPLAFATGSQEYEDHVLYAIDDSFRQKVSFIPTCALNIRSMYIKMNQGAHATASISTVYLSRWSINNMRTGITKFWIDGVPYMAMDGNIQSFSNNAYDNFTFDIIVRKPIQSLVSLLTYPFTMFENNKE